SGTPAEAGPFSIVVAATDANNCTATMAYEFAILNPPPGISAAGPISVTADGSASIVTVATVSDSVLSPATLTVQAVGTPAGINVVGFKNMGGTITAYVGASCGTAPGPYSVALQVTDGVNTAMANLSVNVAAEQTPVIGLSYPAQVTVGEGQSAVVNSKTPLATGQITRAVSFNNGPGGYDGTISVSPTGAVTMVGVGPSGSTFTVDVTVLFNCGVTKDVTFTLVVSCSSDSFSLSSSSASIPKAGGSGAVMVFAPGMCSWNAVSNAPWITVTSGASGASDGAVAFSVSPTTTLRSGTITIAGQTFTISQDCPTPVITASPVNQTMCVGSRAGLSVTASGRNLTYQWRKNGVSISGARSQTFNIASVSANDAGQYDVVVSGDCGSVTSSQATLSVSSPVVTSQPANQWAAAGGSATFSLTVKSLVPYSVQWQASGGNGGFTDIPGATGATLTLSGITIAQNGNFYRAMLSSSCGTSSS
ncbi:MAG: immunoglobulin domain-containing protein, partial [Blastocatellia bacterium]